MKIVRGSAKAARLLVRLTRLAGLMTLGFSLMASSCVPLGHGDQAVVETMTFNSTDYRPITNARIPDSDLTVVGEATALDVTYYLVTDPTVLSLRDVDPGAVVAMTWDRASWRPSEDEPDAPTWNVVLFQAIDGSELPATICRYFEPRDLDSVTVCQVPVTVMYDGRAYMPVEAFDDPRDAAPKCGSDEFTFTADDLVDLGGLAEVDPRLDVGATVPLDPAPRGIRGVDPNAAIVLHRGTGERPCLFIAIDAAEIPIELCAFLTRAPGGSGVEDGALSPRRCGEGGS